MELKPKGIVRSQLTQANIGEDYWSCDFSNYGGPRNVKRATIEYAGNLADYVDEGIGILYAGKPGTGKTTIATILLKYLVRSGWTCYMTSLSEIIEEIKRGWDEKENSHEFISKCKQATYLFIDDVGKEHAGPTGFSSVVFDNLLRYRVQHRLPTIFTTNLNRSAIKERYGDALLSLIEGRCKVIEVNGSDYRTSTQKPLITGTNSRVGKANTSALHD